MTRLFSLLLLLAATAQGTIFEVCNGCSGGNKYTYAQDALDAASRGDTIILAAGQTHFGKASFPRPLQLKHKGADAQYITFITSRWLELPPSGTRIDPVRHGHLLATIANELNDDPAVFQAEDYAGMSSVNTGADTITFAFDPGWSNGTPVGCAATYVGGTMPTGMAENVTYYVVSKSGATMGFSATSGGSAINLTGTFSVGANCHSELQTHHYRFIGIRFARGANRAGAMVVIASGSEPTPAAYGHHIQFQHTVFCGLLASNTNCAYTGVGDYYSGPIAGLFANTNYLEVKDSWFGHFWLEASESKALVVNWSSNSRFINNRFSAASMPVLVAGSIQPIQNYSSHDIKFIGNLLEGEAHYYWSTGSGAPSGDCENGTLDTNGAYYVNSAGTGGSSCSGTKCWVCNTSRTWVQRTDVDYRPNHVLSKALFEAKETLNITFEENVLRGGFTGFDTGNPNTCILLSQAAIQSPWTAISGTFRYNFCEEGWRFFTADNAYPYTFTRQIGPVLAEHNIGKNLVKHPSRNVHASASTVFSQASQWGDGIENVTFRHNTITQAGTSLQYIMLLGHEDAAYTMPNWKYTANIATGTTFLGAGNCTQLGAFLTSPSTQLTRSVWYGASATNPFSACTTDVAAETTIALESDLSITPDSKYSKSCTLGGGCGFLAEDGTEIGADVPLVNWHISGSIFGSPKWMGENWSVVRGSDHVAVHYDAPSTAACDLKLYTNAARTTLHADTSDAGEQTDSRTGNYSSGTHRIFVLGTNTPLTAGTTYSAVLTCGTQVRPFDIVTRAAGSGTRTFTIRYSEALDGEYSSSPSFSSPTGTSGTSHDIVAAPVAFYRQGGMVRAFVAP